MNVEHVYNKIRYTLSNDDLKAGDKVFPIANGRCLDDGSWILSYLEYEEYKHTGSETDFPDEPHTIIDMKHSDYKPYEVRTDMGYGPREMYYKIIKREHQVDNRREGVTFSHWEWVEIPETV